MTPLTEHFSQQELGVFGCDQRLIDNAAALCTYLLEPIRAHFGAPVRIHDGYRDARHNARVGGKAASFHLFDDTQAAADFDVVQMDLRSTFDWIRLASGLPFDKVILELGANEQPATVHIQFDRVAAPRREAYIGHTGAATVYTPVEVR